MQQFTQQVITLEDHLVAFQRIASRYLVKRADDGVVDHHETLYGAISVAVEAWRESRVEIHVFDNQSDEQHLVTIYADGTLSMSERAVTRIYGIRV